MTININAANITSIRLAEQSSAPSTPASGFASLFVDTNGDLATRKDAGGIKIATSPASGDYTLTVDGTGTAARLNASNVFTSAQVMPAGTNSAPALTTTGDTNTGIYFPAADNIGFSTGGTIRGRWTTDGLCFNADTAAANALDDYEEGTWTPLAADANSGGNTTTTGTGHYTKIGRQVIANFRLTDINTTGLTAGNAFVVQGLPFATGVFADRAMGSVALADIAFSGYVVPYPIGGAGSFRLVECVSGAPFAELTVSDVEDDTGDITGTIIYIA